MKAREVIARGVLAKGTHPDYASAYLPHADAILAALAREGLAVVPAEPTEAMLDALYGSYWRQTSDTQEDCKRAYRTMIAAAQKETDHDE